MGALLKMTGVMLVGALAMAAIAWGWGWWLGWAMGVGEEHGPVWRGVAITGMGALNVAVAFVLFRWQDRLTRAMDFRLGGRAPRDALYCQRCGAAVSGSAVACGVCGGTRFGLARPAAQRRS